MSAHTLKKVGLVRFCLVFLAPASFPHTLGFSYLVQGTVKANESIQKGGRNGSITLLYSIYGLQGKVMKPAEMQTEQESTPKLPLTAEFHICNSTALGVYLLRQKKNPKLVYNRIGFIKMRFFFSDPQPE